MVALGFGKFARADRIFALERITGEERGDGRRTRVWIDGVADPLIASRTEVTILRDMGQEAAIAGPELDEALDLAARLAAAADAGRVDLNDLGRRARRLLASTSRLGSRKGHPLCATYRNARQRRRPDQDTEDWSTTATPPPCGR